MVGEVLRALVLVASLASIAHADPIVLRMAAVAPEGTSWARILKAFDQELGAATQGQIKMKWYLGGIAGDEVTSIERIRRGQLDGFAGAAACERLAPSIKVMRIPGVFLERPEHMYVMARLQPKLVEEFRRSGFEVLTLSPFGADILFSRTPFHSWNDLKSLKMWVWDTDSVMRELTTAMGLTTVPMPLDQVRQGLESGKLDGMFALPSAALAYQWSTRVKYFMDLHIDVLPGCMVVASRAFDRLSPVHQADLREAGARMGIRFGEAGRALDDALLGGLFEKQGLIKLPASESMRSAFFAAARVARDKAAPEVVPRALLDQVLGWLADYRAEHPR
jgi:TRAP-type C4-dicarboxylate transport system substrate-binding protein